GGGAKSGGEPGCVGDRWRAERHGFGGGGEGPKVHVVVVEPGQHGTAGGVENLARPPLQPATDLADRVSVDADVDVPLALHLAVDDEQALHWIRANVTVLAVDELGPLTGRPVDVVDSGDIHAARAVTRLPLLPCVVVGVGEPGGLDGAAAAATDVLFTAQAGAPAPWVHVPDVDDAIRFLTDAVVRSPAAAATLAQVLRVGEDADVASAIVIESLAYGMLQAGPEFKAWLAGRTPKGHRPQDEPVVLVEREGDSLTITLNRPAVHNAYDAATRDALAAALELVAADGSITDVHLRGAGPSFSAGGDLAEFGTTPDPTTGHLIRTTRSAAALLATHADRVTAHLHGACVGAGIELPAFAGTVSATGDATFRLPEVAMGLIPGAGGTASIPRRIGRHRTAWLALTGAELDARQAAAWGLVDEVH
ncbi:MAG: putative Enoyl-CoA hydratase, partial [Acidimicrobiales bacterium]|nr:putative Enoyl-CoA hydratase [Acidimicrobiales bacterium]